MTASVLKTKMAVNYVTTAAEREEVNPEAHFHCSQNANTDIPSVLIAPIRTH